MIHLSSDGGVEDVSESHLDLSLSSLGGGEDGGFLIIILESRP